MPRKIRTEWETGFNCLRRYVKINGNTKVPFDYVTQNGFKLGGWVSLQKTMHRAGALSPRAARLLESIPYWKREEKRGSLQANKWRRAFKKLQTYVRREGHYSPPVDFVTQNGFRLGAWVAAQRTLFKKGLLAPERKKLLESIPGWQWKMKNLSWQKKWLDKLSGLKAYIRRRGNGNVPRHYTAQNGFNLGGWVATQRYCCNCGHLDKWKQNLLEQIPGWKWRAHKSPKTNNRKRSYKLRPRSKKSISRTKSD